MGPTRRSVPLPRLHVLTDMGTQQRFTHVELAERALRGGADGIQLRDKLRQPDDPGLRDDLAAVVRLCRRHGAQCIVDDHVRLAVDEGADGAHVGPTDLPPRSARTLLGFRRLLGVTANDLSRVQALAGSPADYLGVGPVFGTTSKANPPPRLGLDGLARIVAASPLPVIAIGGITVDRVADVLGTGAWGIAVLGGVVCQDDPERATRAYRQAIDAALATAGGPS